MKTWWVIDCRPGLTLHGRRPHRWLPRQRCTFYLRKGANVYRLTATPFQGICVTAMWPRCSPLGHLDPPHHSWERPSMKKKLSKTEGAIMKHLAAVETEILRGLLPLVEHCAVRQYDDGDPRETGWITLKTQGSAWVVQVKDPDSGCSFSAVAESLDKALETAALLLSCDDAPWEPDQWLMKQRASRKKSS